MDGDKQTRRSFNEKEIGPLIQRATELHEVAMGKSERSLSLKEIESIAAELGLPPEYVRTAALELAGQRDADTRTNLWGGPFVVDQTRVVDETMSEEQWGEIVLELRSSAGGAGHVSEIGKAREWFRWVGEGDGGFNLAKTRVSVRPGNEETIIRIQKHYGGAAIMAYLAALLLIAFSVGFSLTEGFSDLASLGIGAGICAVVLSAVRTSISLWGRRQRARVNKLADVIVNTLSNPPSKVELNESASALIDVPAMDESAQSSALKRRVRS